MSISANAQLWAFQTVHPSRPRSEGRWLPITVGEQLNAGAYGGTSAILRITTPGFTSHVAKVFNETALPRRRTVEAHEKLATIAHYSPVFRGGYVGRDMRIPGRPHVAWPELVLYNAQSAVPENLVGFVMPVFHGLQPLQLLYTPKHRKAHFPNASADTLMAVAASLADCVDKLHGGAADSGIIIADLTPRNIMIGPNWDLRLIDADSYQYSTGNHVHGSNESTPGFRSPAVAAAAKAGQPLPLFTRDDDAYALAIVIFHLLVDGAHPWRAGSRFEINGTEPDDEDNMLARRFPYAAPDQLFPPRIRLQTYQKLPAPVRSAFLQTFCGNHPVTPGEWAGLLGRARAARFDLGSVRPSEERRRVA